MHRTWNGTKWFIEGDLSQFFDSLDHEILLGILAEKIHDGRFLRLVKELLKAGYLEDWKLGATLSGVPQGGVVSPVLSGIYLDRFDKWVRLPCCLPTTEESSGARIRRTMHFFAAPGGWLGRVTPEKQQCCASEPSCFRVLILLILPTDDCDTCGTQMTGCSGSAARGRKPR